MKQNKNGAGDLFDERILNFYWHVCNGFIARKLLTWYSKWSSVIPLLWIHLFLKYKRITKKFRRTMFLTIKWQTLHTQVFCKHDMPYHPIFRLKIPSWPSDPSLPFGRDVKILFQCKCMPFHWTVFSDFPTNKKIDLRFLQGWGGSLRNTVYDVCIKLQNRSLWSSNFSSYPLSILPSARWMTAIARTEI